MGLFLGALAFINFVDIAVFGAVFAGITAIKVYSQRQAGLARDCRRADRCSARPGAGCCSLSSVLLLVPQSSERCNAG